MERGVYFDGWSPQTYCQPPGMPPRRLAMLDDLQQMGASILVWAALGGGSISLPFLEEEAYGPIPARFRHHGYVSDAEFIRHARQRGIEVCAIVFESQAWEFLAEVADGEVLAQCEPRGAAAAGSVGLREFSSDQGPATWPPFQRYFPDGLTNSAGEPVADLWQEVACRDLDGQPLHAHWVEVAAREQACFYADRNNPVWREYLKAIIRIQIDAGATAIQLDETDTPMSALRYGGCFCRDCVERFRQHLRALAPDRLPAELAGVDLDDFDYGAWLREQGFRARCNPRTLPLYREWVRCLQVAIAETFHEVVAYARGYAAEQGAGLRIGGNFYDLAPYWDPLVADVDLLVTEMRETRFQQPWYFRHGVGLARGRPLVAVENPYGGVVPRLVQTLSSGRGWDLFRLTIFEASAMGANMALPYGSWLGTEIKDSYWVPHRLASEVGAFLRDIDPLISATSPHTTAVVFSCPSLVDHTIDSDQFSDGPRWFPEVRVADARPASYWSAIEELSRTSRTFDVVVFSDEGLRADDHPALEGYRTLVLPDVWAVSNEQHRKLTSFLDSGGSVVIVGDYGTTLTAGVAAELLEHPRARRVSVEELGCAVPAQVRADLGRLAAVNLHAVADGVAIHVVNYDYDPDTDRIRGRVDVAVSVLLDGPFAPTAMLHRPGKSAAQLHVSRNQDGWRLTIPRLDTYAVLALRWAD